MGLFSMFFGKSVFSRDWPPSTGYIPEVDLQRGAIGSLRFGDPIEAARSFGKPTEHRIYGSDASAQSGSGNLQYRDIGLELEYERGRFVLMAFVIAEEEGGVRYVNKSVEPSVLMASVIAEEDHPTHPPKQLARPRLSDGTELTPDTTEADLTRRFGTPKSRDEDEDETVVIYELPNTTVMEFEFNAAGKLMRWNYYLND